MSFWLVVLQVWNAINSYADWNSYKLVKPLQLTRFCLNFSPFRKKKSAAWQTLLASAVCFFLLLV